MNKSIRHWKERFDAKSTFITLRTIQVNGITYRPGEELPLELPALKLKRWWDAKLIGLKTNSGEAKPVRKGKKQR